MIAQFIQQQRNKHGFSQEYMASALGISRPTYMQIELGERDITVTEANKLAEIFGMALEDFLAFNNRKDHEVILEKERKTPRPDIEIRVTQKNLEKFKQVLLYVLGKVGGKPNVGETVLNKLLYFIDFDYFEKFEENLMGATYIKNHHGPTPVELKAVVDNMKEKGEIEEVKSKYFTHEQKKYLPLKRANLSLLTGREIEHIDQVLARLSDKNANEISEYSHHDVPWLTRKFGDTLSYESVFYRDEKYSVRNYSDAL